MRAVLLSTYELGRQPFGLASPAAWLTARGVSVTCLDLAVDALNPEAVRTADLVAVYLPMHTATRLAIPVLRRVRELNPGGHLCCYGLYAAANEALLREVGVETIVSGEFEGVLVSLVERLQAGDRPPGQQREPVVSVAKQSFVVPDRSGLPDLRRYAKLLMPGGDSRVTGYTEASRGCKHLCRHCPVVPVYSGHFRIVDPQVVLDDIGQQVAAGARHITFGDPDFLNGPRHAFGLVERLHARFPDLTYDVTIKVEHLLAHATRLPRLRDTGCLFVTTAVEALDDEVLRLLEKGHTRRDFFEVVTLFEHLGIALHPTFVAFTPWTTLEGYRDFLTVIGELDLVNNVAPVQYGIRLLIPRGSRLLELPSILAASGAFDPEALCYPWIHPDPSVDALQQRVMDSVRAAARSGVDRRTVFGEVCKLAFDDSIECSRVGAMPRLTARDVPRLSEAWYC